METAEDKLFIQSVLSSLERDSNDDLVSELER